MKPGTDQDLLRFAAVYDDALPAWRSFYPEGLPEEWRLAYYAHHWKALLLPNAAWATFAADTAWVADYPDGLKVYLEVPPALQPAFPSCGRLLEAMGERIGGFLLDQGESPVAAIGPDRVFVRAASPEFRGARSADLFQGSAGVVLVLEPDPGLPLPAWRALLESVAAWLPDRRHPVFLRAGPRELENAETIRQLAGLV